MLQLGLKEHMNFKWLLRTTRNNREHRKISWNKYIGTHKYSERILEWLFLTSSIYSQAFSQNGLLGQGHIKMDTVLNREIPYCRLSALVS